MTAEAAPAVRVPSLSIDVHEYAGTAVVRVLGELDTAVAACLQPVVEAHRSAPGTGCSLVLRSAPAVDRLLHLTGLEDLLPRVPG